VSSDGRQTVLCLIADVGGGMSRKRRVASSGDGMSAATAKKPQRVDDEPDDGVLGDHPQAPDHGAREHFQQLDRRYGHNAVAAVGQHGHRDYDLPRARINLIYIYRVRRNCPLGQIGKKNELKCSSYKRTILIRRVAYTNQQDTYPKCCCSPDNTQPTSACTCVRLVYSFPASR